MGLFSKKEAKKDIGLPKLPELPNLPSRFPSMDDDFSDDEEVHKLPSFPNNSMGNKFSQETIKNAISEEDEEEYERSPESFIPQPTFKPLPKPTYTGGKEDSQIKKSVLKDDHEESEKERGPVFIRIDKFEEALKIFKDTKGKLDEIEKLLSETKELKDKEEKELSMWEKEIQEMKAQIEKVDKDIFSKI